MTAPVPVSPADLSTMAGQELARLVTRLRSIGAARLASSGRPPYPTRADVVRHLVDRCTDLSGDAPAHGHPPRLPDLALGDQLAVVGQDALAALTSRSFATDDLLLLLGEIVLHRWDVDGSLPSGDVADTLGGGDLVDRLRARCPVG